MNLSVADIAGLIIALGGGAGITTFITARRRARQMQAETDSLEAKTPVEVDSIVVQGAEAAVRTLQTVNGSLVEDNQRLRDDNQRLFTENARLRSTIEQLEERLESYRASLQRAEEALREAREEQSAIQAQIASIRPAADQAE